MLKKVGNNAAVDAGPLAAVTVLESALEDLAVLEAKLRSAAALPEDTTAITKNDKRAVIKTDPVEYTATYEETAAVKASIALLKGKLSDAAKSLQEFEDKFEDWRK